MSSSNVVAATLGAAHGLKGWLKLHAHTELADDILDYQPWYIQWQGNERIVVCDAHRFQGSQLLVHLTGFDSRDAILPLINQSVYIKAEQLPRLAKGEYYWRDLIGLRVHNLEGCDFGKITSMMATGANDVMLIDGDKQRCVPYLPKQVIQRVDLTEGMMIVDWSAEF